MHVLHTCPRVENMEGLNLMIRTGLCVTTRVDTLITKDRIVCHNKGAHNDTITKKRGGDMVQYCGQGRDDPDGSHESTDSQLASVGPHYYPRCRMDER